MHSIKNDPEQSFSVILLKNKKNWSVEGGRNLLVKFATNGKCIEIESNDYFFQ